MKQFRLFIIGSLCFLLFVSFSYLVHKDFFSQFDFDTTVRLQDNIARRFDASFSFLSDIGAFEIMLGFFGLFHLIELYGKLFVDHLPPPEFMLRTERILNFPQYHIRLENSYPSGHAGRAAFLTILIGLLVWRSK